MDKHATAVHQLLLLAEWTENLHPGLWVPPAGIQACLPWVRSWLRELVESGRVDERRYTLPNGRILRMASVHDALAIVERSAARAERSKLRRRGADLGDELAL